MPTALLVFPGNRRRLAGNNLLARGALCRFPGLSVSRECFRERAIDPVGPPSIVFDDPEIDRVNSSVQAPLARAKHVELHGRLAEGSAVDHPVIETVLRLEGGSLQEVHPLLTEPFDAEVRTMLSCLKDFSPKPWPERFREIQAAGGHVEIVQSRVQQGELIAVAAGTLGLSPQGRLDGELQMTVAGIEKVIPALGIDVQGFDGIREFYLDRFEKWPGPALKSFTRVSVVDNCIYVEGEFYVEGSGDDLQSLNISGKSVKSPCMIALECRDGLLVGEIVYMDSGVLKVS